MEIKTIPPDTGGSSAGAILADGTVPLTSAWDTGNVLIKGPSAIYTSSTAPLSPYTGMLWNDTSIASRQMIKKWNGSAWVAVAGYEATSRTIYLVHDHGALITGAIFDSVFNLDIGRIGSSGVTVDIENKTYKTFTADAAVDAGGGLVKLPIASGHGFLAGERVCIDGTVNYDGVFIISSVRVNYIIIPATYVAETIPANAVIRVVIEGGSTISGYVTPLIIQAHGWSSGRTQKQKVVFFSNTNAPALNIRGLTSECYVGGIKFVSEITTGSVATSCATITYDSCSVLGKTISPAFAGAYGGLIRITDCQIRKSHTAIYSFYGATILSNNNETISSVTYGLVADQGGLIIKTSAQQPTGSTANEYAVTSRGGRII